MATKTELGKIETAEFKLINGYLLGLELCFLLNGGGSGICDSGRNMVNVNEECEWDLPRQRSEAMEKVMDSIHTILEAAKVDCVSKLKNVPVEVIIEGNSFKSFRILTEVL